MAQERVPGGIGGLLIDAMHRHIEWLGEDEDLELVKFRTDHSVSVGPVFYSSELPDRTTEQTKCIEAKTYALVHYARPGRGVDVLVAEEVLDATPRRSTFMGEDGKAYTSYSFEPINLTTSEDKDHFYTLTLFDVLALFAAEDARRDGRAEDEAALVGMLPTCETIEIPDPWPNDTDTPDMWIANRSYRTIDDDTFDAVSAAVWAEYKKSIKKSAEDTPLAQYAKTEIFQNHDLSAKAIDGLFAVAMGESSYTLAPRSGKSQESYTLTASEDACAKLFGVRGANAEQVRAILGTVQSLRKDPRAAEFAHEGRVWFTVNRIAEELLRTSAGTIRAKDYPNAHVLVDAALEAASGAQIKATSPDGVTSTVVYLLDAVRLDEVTYNGETYRDVWGIAVSSETLAEYAEAKGHAYRYALPNRDRPFTLDTVWINEYLSNAMHEARGRLYVVTKAGRIARRRGVNTVTITRAWQGGERAIFDLASPTRVLTSRQKDKVVRGFEDVLTDLVREEAHGERHEGMPLYVRAWSERDGGRGRGKGAYRNLCLEVSTTFRTVRDGEAGHGSINLRDGVSKAAPDNAAK